MSALNHHPRIHLRPLQSIVFSLNQHFDWTLNSAMPGYSLDRVDLCVTTISSHEKKPSHKRANGAHQHDTGRPYISAPLLTEYGPSTKSPSPILASGTSNVAGVHLFAASFPGEHREFNFQLGNVRVQIPI